MSSRNTGLGRGLEALFGDVEISIKENKEPKGRTKSQDKDLSTDENSIIFININNIKPNPKQPRKSFDEEKLNELASSIIEHGVIQPVVLRKSDSGEGFELVAGERRWRAARKAGLKEIPSIIRTLTEEQNMLLSIIENMQREDLNPIEEAEAIHKMMTTFKLTQEEISKSLGKSRPYIANMVRLLKLPDEIRELISLEKLSAGHGRALLSVTGKRQLDLAHAAVKDGLSVREVEKMAAVTVTRKKSVRKVKDTDIVRVEEELKSIFGTKVVLKYNGKKGKIEIEYYSREELERLIDLFRNMN